MEIRKSRIPRIPHPEPAEVGADTPKKPWSKPTIYIPDDVQETGTAPTPSNIEDSSYYPTS